MKHVMIDLETLSDRFDSPIIAIGATEFDIDSGVLGETFYAGISVADALNYGKPKGETIVWWMKQSDAARQAAIAGTQDLRSALGDFEQWLAQFDDFSPWGNGASFDITILEHAYWRCFGRPAPWKFWNIRDCRTIKMIGEKIGVAVPKMTGGVAHNALDDAIHQAKWVSAIYQKIGLKAGWSSEEI